MGPLLLVFFCSGAAGLIDLGSPAEELSEARARLESGDAAGAGSA